MSVKGIPFANPELSEAVSFESDYDIAAIKP